MIGDWRSRAASVAVAVAVGLLIGLDREKQKSAGDAADTAGVRTFTLVALLGAIAALLRSDIMLAVTGAGVVVLAALSYRADRARHPGQTTEFALLSTFGIGFMAIGQVELAASLGVLIALLLNAKSRLHKFAVTQLSARELNDAVLLAGAALIVAPLLPDRPIDPFGVVNLRVVWSLTILVLGVNALGYVARRAVGARAGLAIAGFFGGFVSSIVTIAATGKQGRDDPGLLPSAVAGAAFSSIATSIELLAILWMTNVSLLAKLGPAITAAGVIAAAYGFVFAGSAGGGTAPAAEAVKGRAFEPKLAVIFAASFAVMLLVAAALRRAFGSDGALATIALGGFVDTHAAAASAARLASAGALDLPAAGLAALLAISANIGVKAVAALIGGGMSFAVRLWPSHAAMLIALWLGWIIANR